MGTYKQTWWWTRLQPHATSSRDQSMGALPVFINKERVHRLAKLGPTLGTGRHRCLRRLVSDLTNLAEDNIRYPHWKSTFHAQI